VTHEGPVWRGRRSGRWLAHGERWRAGFGGGRTGARERPLSPVLGVGSIPFTGFGLVRCCGERGERQSSLQAKLEAAGEACCHPSGAEPRTDYGVSHEGDEAG